MVREKAPKASGSQSRAKNIYRLVVVVAQHVILQNKPVPTKGSCIFGLLREESLFLNDILINAKQCKSDASWQHVYKVRGRLFTWLLGRLA